jgi:DNA-binding NarL/FixJ family response regulator
MALCPSHEIIHRLFGRCFCYTSCRDTGAIMCAARTPSRPWSSGEETQLREMLEAGKEAEEIATELHRTRAAIYARLQRWYRKRPVRDITRGVG